MLGPAYLEGTYSEIYPDKSEDAEGMQKFFKQFSFPGHIGSHVTPETPGSIHEGGELGYSLSHAYGAAFDNPDLIVACVVGDGEAETGPLATAWHSNKFINPVRDGAVLPILNLNGYKIANPTILARISHEELEALFVGYGYKPYFVEGSEPAEMHQKMAATLDAIVAEIRAIQKKARDSGKAERPRWPMIVLRAPKGWTGPKEIDGHKVEGSWRSHQVPFSDVRGNPANLKLLESWMRSYKPEKLFDASGRLLPELKALAPAGRRRMSANPHANGGLLRKELKLPDFRSYAVDVAAGGQGAAREHQAAGRVPARRDAQQHDELPRVRPRRDRLQPPAGDLRGEQEDVDGRPAAGGRRRRRARARRTRDGDALRAHAGRLARRLSAHRPPRLLPHLRGLRARRRLDVQPARQVAGHLQEPRAVARLGVVAEHPAVVDRLAAGSQRLLAPGPGLHRPGDQQEPDASRASTCRRTPTRCSSVADQCLRSTDCINVIVADKQKHLQFTTIDEAIVHCAKGIGIWARASNDEGEEPDVVMASCGDVATQEALAATAILRERLPDLKLRFVNVVDLFKLQPASEHPHGSTEREFDSLFTVDKPIIFNFHGYPWLIHKLAYRFRNHENLHVRGYKEKGNINTPLELAILNQVDRFNLVIDVIDRVPRLQTKAAHLKERDEERDHRQPELRARARHRPRRDHQLGVAELTRGTPGHGAVRRSAVRLGGLT